MGPGRVKSQRLTLIVRCNGKKSTHSWNSWLESRVPEGGSHALSRNPFAGILWAGTSCGHSFLPQEHLPRSFLAHAHARCHHSQPMFTSNPVKPAETKLGTVPAPGSTAWSAPTPRAVHRAVAPVASLRALPAPGAARKSRDHGSLWGVALGRGDVAWPVVVESGWRNGTGMTN